MTTVGRVTEVHRTNFVVRVGDVEYSAVVRGEFHASGEFPKVGDFVRLETLNDEQAVIVALEPRTSVIKRKAADGDEVQIIAANVDRILIVMGLDQDFNMKRLQRYLLLAGQSEVSAAIFLNKSDLSEEVSTQVSAVEQVAGDVPVVVVSAITGAGMEALRALIPPQETVVLLGSSGAGKSTITNWLLQEERQATQETRADDHRGRHTTTARQLFAVPGGGFLIDTPGMRELGVVDVDEDTEQTVFDTIATYAARCRFRDCDHERSAGCAVLAAIDASELDPALLENYQKLQRERVFQDSKDSDRSARYYEQNQKRMHKRNAAIMREKLSRRLR